MKTLKKVIGFIFLFGGIILALYVSVWKMFIQPILAACAAFDAGTLTGMIIGTTILKCVLASVVGTAIYIVFYLIAHALFKSSLKG